MLGSEKPYIARHWCTVCFDSGELGFSVLRGITGASAMPINSAPHATWNMDGFAFVLLRQVVALFWDMLIIERIVDWNFPHTRSKDTPYRWDVSRNRKRPGEGRSPHVDRRS